MEDLLTLTKCRDRSQNNSMRKAIVEIVCLKLHALFHIDTNIFFKYMLPPSSGTLQWHPPVEYPTVYRESCLVEHTPPQRLQRTLPRALHWATLSRRQKGRPAEVPGRRRFCTTSAPGGAAETIRIRLPAEKTTRRTMSTPLNILSWTGRLNSTSVIDRCQKVD